MESHSEEHERMLERVIVGELDPMASEVRAQLVQCGICAERLATLQALAGRLSDAGALERSGVAEAAQGRPDPRAERRVREFVNERVGAQPKRKPWLAWAGLAAAASLAGVLVYRQVSAPDPVTVPGNGGEVLLGEGDLEPVHPVDAVESFLPFEWRAPEMASSDYFQLTVWNEDAPDSKPFVVEYIRQARWDRSPTTGGVYDEQQAKALFGPDGEAMAKKIRWKVEMFGTQVLATASSDWVSAHKE